jgi:hypothetical protein
VSLPEMLVVDAVVMVAGSQASRQAAVPSGEDQMNKRAPTTSHCDAAGMG